MEADIQEKRLRRILAKKLRSALFRRYRSIEHLVVANARYIAGNVLLTGQHAGISGYAQRVQDMLGIVVQAKPKMGQTLHPVRMRVSAGQQCGAAGGTGRRGAERLAE